MRRFWSKVKRGPGCWEWTGSKDRNGYGGIRIGGKLKKAHRVSWELGHGSIPKDMCVCHTCDNPSCVRLSHLWLGTKKDNTQDAINKNRLRIDCLGGLGEAHPNSTLTTFDVRSIRKDNRLQAIIAQEYGIDPSTVSCIKRRTRWKHLQ